MELPAASLSSPALRFHAFTAAPQYVYQSVPHLHDLHWIRYTVLPFLLSIFPSMTGHPQNGHGFADIFFIITSRGARKDLNLRPSLFRAHTETLFPD